MKKLQILLFALGLCLVATSCSKEEVMNNDSSSKGSISFGAILQDMVSNRIASKQSIDDLPDCTDDDASYVRIILSRDGVNVVGSQQAPFRIDLVTDQNFTEEVPELELDPGNYSLDYFGVYNADGDLIWVAPTGGIFSEFLENPMPIDIDLNAGVKKYVEVSVLCFDNRFVNEYGYLFFDIDTNRAIEFCIFGNYCDQTGRHYPAAYSVDIWSYSNGETGTQLYSNVENSVSLNDAGDYAGTPLCFALPDAAGMDQYYIEISLLNSDAYGNVTEEVIRSGVITDEDVRNLFDGADATEYFHFREGACNDDDSPDLFDVGELGLTSQYNADVATAWMTLLANLSRYTFYFNPQSARIFAYSGLTLYESVVPGMPSYQSIFNELSGETINFEGDPSDYYWPASANAALAEIAKKLVQDYPQIPNLAAINQLEADFIEEFRDEITLDQLQRSIEFGQLVANEIYEWSRTDGTFTPCPPYTPIGAPGTWIPTPPMFFPAAGACQGDLRTFIPGIVEATFPSPPPPYSADPESDFYEMNVAVYEITQNLTPEELKIIQAWRDISGVNHNRPSHLFQLTSNLITEEDVNLADASVLFAKQGIAIFDAIVSNFSAKFAYALIRPVTYIHNILGHTTWTSVYPAPQHPSYPASSTGVTAAAVEVLEEFFGENYAFEDKTQDALYGVFSYESFADMLENAAFSRTHSGINYQFSVDVGLAMGRAVGERVVDLDFKFE